MRRLFRNLDQKYKESTLWLFNKIKRAFRGKYQELSLNDMSRKRGGFACSSEHQHYLLHKPEQWPLITISIVTYNGEKWINNFIESICNQDYPLEYICICFVDHGSEDDTWKLVETFRDEMSGVLADIRCHQQPNNGYGAGHDYAIRNASTKMVLITNIDLEFMPDTLTKLISRAEADDCKVASWEACQVPYEHPKHYDPITFETSWSSHACVLVDRNKYMEVGGYEKMIFMYGEDVELSYRFRSYGFLLRYVPDAKVIHHTYGSPGQIKALQFAGSTLANIYIRLRYGSLSDVLLGYLLQVRLLIVGGGFSGSRRVAASNFLKSIIHAPSFIFYRKKRGANFAFYWYDYEITRDGAFYVTEPNHSDELPLVSVVTRTVEGRGFLLRECIASVLNQTYPNIEHLIVEDGGASAYDLVQEISRNFIYKDGYTIQHIDAPKKGRSYAGNLGLAGAKGEYIVFLDDDDLLYPDHIEVLFSALRKRNASAAYSLAWEVLTEIDKESESYNETSYEVLKGLRQEFDRDILFERNYFPLQTVLFPRIFYERYGGFEEDMDCLEDWVLWCRYAVNNEFVHVPKTTSLYRTPAGHCKRLARVELLQNAYTDAKRRVNAIFKASR